MSPPAHRQLSSRRPEQPPHPEVRSGRQPVFSEQRLRKFPVEAGQAGGSGPKQLPQQPVSPPLPPLSDGIP